MKRWLKSLFAWRHAFDAGVFTYEQNEITGKRRAFRCSNGYSPLDMQWLIEGAGMPDIDGTPAWRSRYRGMLPQGWVWE
jgi:hypothetical protein